jgi:bacteriocin-like protein
MFDNLNELNSSELNQINGGGLAFGLIGAGLGGLGGIAVATYHGASFNNTMKAATASALFFGGCGAVIPEP